MNYEDYLLLESPGNQKTNNFMAKAKKHIHQYKREKLGGKTIYKCTLPGCPHYLYRQFMDNVVSLCNECGNPFIMTKYGLRLAKPHCNDCTKPELAKREKLEKLREYLLANDK